MCVSVKWEAKKCIHLDVCVPYIMLRGHSAQPWVPSEAGKASEFLDSIVLLLDLGACISSAYSPRQQTYPVPPIADGLSCLRDSPRSLLATLECLLAHGPGRGLGVVVAPMAFDFLRFVKRVYHCHFIGLSPFDCRRSLFLFIHSS